MRSCPSFFAHRTKRLYPPTYTHRTLFHHNKDARHCNQLLTSSPRTDNTERNFILFLDEQAITFAVSAQPFLPFTRSRVLLPPPPSSCTSPLHTLLLFPSPKCLKTSVLFLLFSPAAEDKKTEDQLCPPPPSPPSLLIFLVPRP